jgi:predicted ATPase
MATAHKPNFFVLTGGPGVGKTTLIRHLEAMGELVVEETARAVIREQIACGGRAVPWIDPETFAEETARRDTALFDGLASETRRVFFDRGIMDSHGTNGVVPSPEIVEAVGTRRYNACVFVAPPWREIYETDNERRQDWAEAERTFDVIRQKLPTLGYAPVVLPKASVEARAAFVLRLTARAAR